MAGPELDDQVARLIELICAQPIIADRYKNVQRRVDSADGHFSLIMDATDTRTGELIVLKFLNPQETDQYRKRAFVREAQILTQFVGQDDVVQLRGELTSHQLNLVDKVTGISLQIPLSLFALERATQSLTSYLLARPNPPGLPRRLAIVRDVVKGVNRLHQHGFCHRDLKPDNILLFPGGAAKLGDLGTCRATGEDERLAADYFAPVGEIRFSAPELFFGSGNSPDLHKGSDWFSVGSVVFETVTGMNLYVAIGLGNDDLVQMMQRYAQLPPAERLQQFLRVVEGISGQYPVPSVREFQHQPWLSGVTTETLSSLDGLITALCHFDFRKRLQVFEAILRKVDISAMHVRVSAAARARRFSSGH